MATSSIFHNVIITKKEDAERFVKALEESRLREVMFIKKLSQLPIIVPKRDSQGKAIFTKEEFDGWEDD